MRLCLFGTISIVCHALRTIRPPPSRRKNGIIFILSKLPTIGTALPSTLILMLSARSPWNIPNSIWWVWSGMVILWLWSGMVTWCWWFGMVTLWPWAGIVTVWLWPGMVTLWLWPGILTVWLWPGIVTLWLWLGIVKSCECEPIV